MPHNIIYCLLLTLNDSEQKRMIVPTNCDELAWMFSAVVAVLLLQKMIRCSLCFEENLLPLRTAEADRDCTSCLRYPCSTERWPNVIKSGRRKCYVKFGLGGIPDLDCNRW